MNDATAAITNRIRHRLLVRREETHSSASLADAVAEAAALRPKRIGLDVFDTVLVRRVVGDAAGESVVAQAQRRAGLWPGSGAEWGRARVEAWEGEPNGTLSEWFESPGFAMLRSPSEAVAVELATELELLGAVHGAREALSQLRAIAPLTFVSDMYLSEESLRDLLASNQLLDQADAVVVSCDERASKSEGGLFRVAFPDRLLDSNEVLFIGNNAWSDGAMAVASGARAFHVAVANPSRYEDALALRPDSVGPIVGGAARLERLELEADATDDSRVKQVGAGVLAPLMIGFVLWARDRCRQLGISRLEFLSRDGELPLQVARALPSDFWTGFSLNYLQCSRRAWSLAAAPLVGIEEWIRVGTRDDSAFLLHSSSSAPFRSLLDRCGLAKTDLPQASTLRSADDDHPLDQFQSAAWADLLRSGDLDRAIMKAAAVPTRDLIDFLRQSDLPKQRLALVDVGWRGQQAWLMSALIEEATGHEPVHLHFGGDQVVKAVDEATHIERFALDDSVEDHPIDSPVSCLEMFLANGEPRLMGYAREGDRVVERFGAGEPEIASQTRRWLVEGALGAAERMPTLEECERWLGSPMEGEAACLRHEVRSVLSTFWNSPSEHEALALSELRYEVDDVGHVVGSVVRPYGFDDLVGHAEIPRQWREASMVLTPQPLRLLVRTLQTLRRR